MSNRKESKLTSSAYDFDYNRNADLLNFPFLGNLSNRFARPLSKKRQIVQQVLNDGKFEIVSNFNSDHGKAFIKEILAYQNINCSIDSKFHLFSNEFRDDIFDRESIDLLNNFISVGGEVKILVEKNLSNKFLTHGDDLKSKIVVVPSRNIKPFPAISCLLTDNSYAEEVPSEASTKHNALFFLNINAADSESEDIRYIVNRKLLLQKHFDYLWKYFSDN